MMGAASMSGGNSRLQAEEALRWVEHADRDVLAAERAMSAPPLKDIAAYHCQQAVEKLLKAALILAAVRPRKTHDVNLLADEVATVFPKLAPLAEPLRRCTLWAFVYRYPHPDDELEPQPETFELQAILSQVAGFRAALREMIGVAT